MTNASARSRFNFLVHDVSRMRRTLFDQALKPFGITRAQWWALGNISRYSELGVVQTELAQLLDTGKVSAGNLIDRLEEAALVRREPDESDRRVKRVFITDLGFGMLDRIALVGAGLDKVLFAGAADADLVAAAQLLDLVKGNISGRCPHRCRFHRQSSAKLFLPVAHGAPRERIRALAPFLSDRQ